MQGDLDKQNFRGTRANVETLGAGEADAMRRNDALQFVLPVGGDAWAEVNPGPVRPYEVLRATSPAVALRFSSVYLVARGGFFLHTVRNQGATAVLYAATASPVALAGGPGTISRNFLVTAFPALSVTAGDLAAAVAGAFSPANTNFPYNDRPIWIPDGVTLQVTGDTVNTQVDINIVVSGPQLASTP